MNTGSFRTSFFFQVIILTVLTAFVGLLAVQSSYAQVSIVMPAPGQMIHVTRHFEPPQMLGLKIDLKNPFNFDFIMDQGESPMSNDVKKEEFNKIIKYFLVSLTTPNRDMWVNLSPYESKRIIPEVFGQTEMGRDLLAQDYVLKQFTASLMYPEDELGKKFWSKIYQEAQARFGTTNINVNTFNKVWIIADKADIYQKGDTAFLIDSHLKVMLEQDYLALQKHNAIQKNTPQNDVDTLGSQVVREIIIPAIEKEVNEGKSFAAVRQVYNAEIMATWFKRTLRTSLLGQVFVNQSKVVGQKLRDPQEMENIYQQYLRAYKKGVFNYIKEDEIPIPGVPTKEQGILPRKYFSGGMESFNPAMLNIISNPAMITWTGVVEKFRGLKESARIFLVAAGFLTNFGATIVAPTDRQEVRLSVLRNELDSRIRINALNGRDLSVIKRQNYDGALDGPMRNLNQEIEVNNDRIKDIEKEISRIREEQTAARTRTPAETELIDRQKAKEEYDSTLTGLSLRIGFLHDRIQRVMANGNFLDQVSRDEAEIEEINKRMLALGRLNQENSDRINELRTQIQEAKSIVKPTPSAQEILLADLRSKIAVNHQVNERFRRLLVTNSESPEAIRWRKEIDLNDEDSGHLQSQIDSIEASLTGIQINAPAARTTRALVKPKSRREFLEDQIKKLENGVAGADKTVSEETIAIWRSRLESLTGGMDALSQSVDKMVPEEVVILRNRLETLRVEINRLDNSSQSNESLVRQSNEDFHGGVNRLAIRNNLRKQAQKERAKSAQANKALASPVVPVTEPSQPVQFFNPVILELVAQISEVEAKIEKGLSEIEDKTGNAREKAELEIITWGATISRLDVQIEKLKRGNNPLIVQLEDVVLRKIIAIDAKMRELQSLERQDVADVVQEREIRRVKRDIDTLNIQLELASTEMKQEVAKLKRKQEWLQSTRTSSSNRGRLKGMMEQVQAQVKKEKPLAILRPTEESSGVHFVPATANSAMTTQPVGGINLSDENLTINIKVDGNGMPLSAGYQDQAMVNLRGLISVITSIKPATTQNVPALNDLIK